MNFSYYPVPHLNSSNDIICEINDGGEVYKFDCEGRIQEQCIMSDACWDVPGGCDQASQLRVANFLKCWEGPDANTEASSDMDLLPSCLEGAGLSSPEQCVSDPQRVEMLSERMRNTKIPMMARLGPDPGSYPHIFVNGEEQGNYSFVALTRTLCAAFPDLDIAPKVCHWDTYYLDFDIQGDNIDIYISIEAFGTWWGAAVQGAANVAVSANALPINFDSADPKYVNVRALNNTQINSCFCNKETNITHLSMSVLVLHAFSDSFEGMSSDRFAGELAEACNGTGIQVSAGSISNVVVSSVGTWAVAV